SISNRRLIYITVLVPSLTSIVEEGKDFALTTVDLGKGLVNLAGDVLKSGYGIEKGAVVVVGAGAAVKLMMETGDAPVCLKKCIT
ncbi:hypothetical protein, partial [Clostridium sp.]|uniref:hypothetical protein n=1 Tax=Clostridium sp. TaxID=1506 RepID=UPI00260532C0